MQDINLVLLLALVLIHAETNGKEDEDATDAHEQVFLERLTSQRCSHSLCVFLSDYHNCPAFCEVA